MKHKTFLFIAGVMAFVTTWPALAGITNGNFSMGSDGLDGWTVEPAGSYQIFTDSGFAVLKEELWESTPLRISQIFSRTDQDGRLSFNVQITSSFMGGDTDIFNAEMIECDALANPTGPTTNLYSWTSGAGPAAISKDITVDLSSLTCDYVYLAFELAPDGIDINPLTTVAISNVATTQQAPIVPVPGAFMLGAVGLGLIAVYRKN